MRLLPFILPALLLGACAPKAVVVEQPAAPGEKPEPREQPVAQTPPVPDPPSGPDDGMLGPRIDRLPSEQEMRPTVNTGGNSSLIARPPSGEVSGE